MSRNCLRNLFGVLFLCFPSFPPTHRTILAVESNQKDFGKGVNSIEASARCRKSSDSLLLKSYDFREQHLQWYIVPIMHDNFVHLIYIIYLCLYTPYRIYFIYEYASYNWIYFKYFMKLIKKFCQKEMKNCLFKLLTQTC